MSKRYPIGTKIIYNPPYQLCSEDELYRGRVGIVVTSSPFPICRFSDENCIDTAWESLRKVKIKNLQLQFAFMEEQNA